MKKYIQPKIEIDTLETKDIILASGIFAQIVGGSSTGVTQTTTEEDVDKDGTVDKVGNITSGIGIFKS